MSATLRDAESVFLAPPFERKGGRRRLCSRVCSTFGRSKVENIACMLTLRKDNKKTPVYGEFIEPMAQLWIEVRGTRFTPKAF
jgi:hypothetical protein